MKKILNVSIVLLAVFLFTNCSSDENFDEATFLRVEGKWKLTRYFTDIAEDENGNPIDTNISNGYELDLKSDKTFTSNEIPGFSGGTYTVVESPGPNLRLVYKNSTQKLILYKYVIDVSDDQLSISYSDVAPYRKGAIFFEGLVLTPNP